MTTKSNQPPKYRGALPQQKLRNCVDPLDLGFETTDTLGDLDGLIGQDRAIDAIKLASKMKHKGFNLFVLGPTGTGRNQAVDTLLNTQANTRPVPCDWAYVNNFEDPNKPKALKLPAGTASKLKYAMQELVDDLGNEIPALFESEDYQSRRRSLEQEFGEQNEKPMADFIEAAGAEDIALMRTPMGYVLMAMRDGEVIKQEEYQKLTAEEQAVIDEKISRFQDRLAEVLRNAPKLEKEHRKRVTALHASMAEGTVSSRMSDLATRFSGIDTVADYLQAVQEDIIENAELFLAAVAEDSNGPFPNAIRKFHLEPQFARYVVNVMVSHNGKSKNGKSTGAPIVKEGLPTLQHLVGRIEHVSVMGALTTDFTLIQPGALHRANGGFLVLDARRVLSEPLAWDALKRSLQNGAVSITSVAERLSLISTSSLEPDPIPLDLRVVLVGDRMLHALLVMLDPDFSELFKLQADFEEDLPRTKANLVLFARLIATVARGEGLKPQTAASIARILDHAARLAEDTKRLSLNIGTLTDVLREADHYASQRRAGLIDLRDVERALAEAERRKSRIKDRMQQAVDRKTILISTTGTAIGQINGLSVVGLGDYHFGRPSRITGRVRMGAGKLIDIEREVDLGGPLHSKGVLILSGYLTSTFALDAPFSLHASLVFEQSYGGVDGDSASSAELYVLLSALSGLPIRQGLAVTGSVNQLGEVQAIGGVNEKIEGFYDTCKARRLTGDQGVLIPKSNVSHLMLRPDVVEAVTKGAFHIIPIDTINAGIEVLTGTKAGRRQKSGTFPKGTVNALVEDRLREFAKKRRSFGQRRGSDQDGEGR
jgi:lon-related putative ATP-dependent protease